jgi:hypothetical protein
MPRSVQLNLTIYKRSEPEILIELRFLVFYEINIVNVRYL